MRNLIFLLGDQLSETLSALQGADPARDAILMAEVREEATYVPHHPKKIVLLFSAMRHFAETLRAKGFTVHYTRLDDTENTHSLEGELARHASALAPERVVMTECGEWRLMEAMRGWSDRLGLPVEIRPDHRFLATHADFTRFAEERQNLVMEFFYRQMRRKTGLLMNGAKPEGGKWNYDHDNREAALKGQIFPTPLRFAPDAITQEVIALVQRTFGNHYGTIEPFGFAVTAAQAEEAFAQFLEEALPNFGRFQDAMVREEAFLFHSVISMYINGGLLDALEVCQAAERAYREGKAPLNAVEGFIRQIIGWREFIRGVYWLKMPGYAEMNALNAARLLPEFYWTANTRMRCMSEAITHTMREAYAHHIHRLMVTGNFALLAGLHPDQVDEWYLAVYADAYQWVEMPNTRGMALFADGGIVGTKPYASSGAYIHRMSNYCERCEYKVKEKTGPDACPFNYLYWDFIARNEARLSPIPRMGMPYRTLARMDPAQVQAMRDQAAIFLTAMEAGERV